MTRHPGRVDARRVVAAGGLALGTTLLAVAANLAATADPVPDGDTPTVGADTADLGTRAGRTAAAAAEAASSGPTATRPVASPTPRAASAAPVRLSLLGQDVPLEPVGILADGSMELPRTPDAGGWWAPGPAPGSPSGTVVIAGHVDTAEHGAGIFAELASIPPKTPITVTTADGRVHHYVVIGLSRHDKDGLPAGLFTSTGPPRLALITCTGAFDPDAGGYQQNLIVIAESS
ncbi:class F sortase [Jiangella aurantiaca]|uniref:Class F sortase n=1 Tax=Jiangella aurantiaca TaxID=2530373 RepID=A0A4R5AGY8_9ACTN|nr:class F sortase [Jiangella aurantiaca]TDD70666.1 class F sortase [Jiangella aurantiaca]